MRGAVKASRKATAAAVSLAMLLPTAALVSVLLLGVSMQSEAARRAGLNAADLKAEDAKKLLRVSILRGPSNESLVNLYAAGRLPINVDYLLAVDADGNVVVEREGVILTLRPGENMTLTPGDLDPALAIYDNDFWGMRRELTSLILHTSDGNTFHASWGPWVGQSAATVTSPGGGATTTYTTTTVTMTVSPTVTTLTSYVMTHTTQYTPFTVTQVAATSTRITTSTTLTTYEYIGFQRCEGYNYWTVTYTLWHTSVRTPFQTTTSTATATARVNIQTTTSLDTQSPSTHTLYIITSVVSAIPSVTTVTSTTTYTQRIWSPVYYTYGYTVYSGLTGWCSYWYYRWSTSTGTVTGTATSVAVTTTTVTEGG